MPAIGGPSSGGGGGATNYVPFDTMYAPVSNSGTLETVMHKSGALAANTLKNAGDSIHGRYYLGVTTATNDAMHARLYFGPAGNNTDTKFVDWTVQLANAAIQYMLEIQMVFDGTNFQCLVGFMSGELTSAGDVITSSFTPTLTGTNYLTITGQDNQSQPMVLNTGKLFYSIG